MAVQTIVKTIGTTGTFSTPQLWEDGGPASLTTAEKSACGTFAVATFIQGEALTFVGSGATGKMLDTDSTGVGTGTYMIYGITSGNPATSDVITGGTSTATCILTSGTADHVGVIWQGQCQNQEFSGAGSQCTIGGSTASAAAYKHLTTVSGASFRDNANVQINALRYNASNGCGIRGTSATSDTMATSETFVRITNVQIAATGSDARALRAVAASTLFDNLICEGTYTSAVTTNGVVALVASATTCTMANSLIIQRASAADHIFGTGDCNVNIYNCTIVAPDLATAPTSIFLSGASGTVTVQNCGLFAGDTGKTINAGSATFNFTTCYTDTASPPAGVTQTTYSSEFVDINNATRDFRLKTGAAQIDTGTTDAVNAAIDIAKTNRPSGAAYDVGAWEFVQAAVNVGWESTGQWL